MASRIASIRRPLCGWKKRASSQKVARHVAVAPGERRELARAARAAAHGRASRRRRRCTPGRAPRCSVARSLECTTSPERRSSWPTRVVPANRSQAVRAGMRRASSPISGTSVALGAEVLDHRRERRRSPGRRVTPRRIAARSIAAGRVGEAVDDHRADDDERGEVEDRPPLGIDSPRTSSENVTVATPFGPNQAMNAFVAVSTRVPASATHTAIGRASRSVTTTRATAPQPSPNRPLERQQRAEDHEDAELDDLDESAARSAK